MLTAKKSKNKVEALPWGVLALAESDMFQSLKSYLDSSFPEAQKLPGYLTNPIILRVACVLGNVLEVNRAVASASRNSQSRENQTRVWVI